MTTAAGTSTVGSRRLPLPVRAVNTGGRIAARLGLRKPSLDADDIRAAAVAAVGHDDFGSREYEEPFRVLTEALAGEARLSPVGRYFARGMVQHALENRLRMQSDWTAHPEILERPIVRPLFIVGLPRTGTTILQNLVALDPANRSLLGWEAASPSPPPDRATYDSDARIAANERTAKLLDYLAPEARALHPVAPTMPTECVTLFVNSFGSLETTTINWVPSYLRWALDADYGPHYAYYRRQLQLLQWKAPGERWLLKSPAHLFWLDELLRCFPDACVVMTHRDPVTAVTSYCSLSAVLCGIGSDDVDLRALGRVWPETWAHGLDRAIAARARTDAGRFFDVHYDAFMADPAGMVQQIYEHFGLPFDATFRDRIRDYIQANPQHKGGAHRYTPAMFGLDATVEHERFAAYRDHFGVRAERLS